MNRAIMWCAVAAALTAAVPAFAEADDHGLVKIVDAYRAARRTDDIEAIKSLKAEGARIWFGKKEGDGSPLKAGGGPWSEWDRFFNATSRVLGEYDVSKRTVTVRVVETNDYYRLLDRPGGIYRATYFFDDDNRISGLLIDGSGEERDPGRYDEFFAWAKEHRPGLLETLMPDDRIDPALDKAKLWKKTLLEWRAEVGLPPIE